MYGNSGMFAFAEINQAPFPCSVLQHVRRVEPPKLLPEHCLRYLQTSLIMEERSLVSEFMWGIVGSFWLKLINLSKYSLNDFLIQNIKNLSDYCFPTCKIWFFVHIKSLSLLLFLLKPWKKLLRCNILRFKVYVDITLLMLDFYPDCIKTLFIA